LGATELALARCADPHLIRGVALVPLITPPQFVSLAARGAMSSQQPGASDMPTFEATGGANGISAIAFERGKNDS